MMKILLVLTIFFLSCGLKDAKEYPLPITTKEEKTEDFFLTVAEKQFVAAVNPGDKVAFTVSEKTLTPILGEVYERTFTTSKKELFCHEDGDWAEGGESQCHTFNRMTSCTLKFRDIEGWGDERLTFFRYDYENHLSVELGGRLYPIEKGNLIKYVDSDVIFSFEVTDEMIKEDNRLYLIPTLKETVTVAAGFVEFGNCPDQALFEFSEDTLGQKEYREQREYLVEVKIKRG